ncbi:Acid sphingomyelinase-like phosphodiesterase 3b isoform 1 [Schistosoma japonicum]|uniref:Acid sphingomyelinase-like phosphodiesterase 3b isoform 1 n=2 Tax=Schistosoma japonicum TaxID=6182 RepID=A0A4Z2CN43_SCHJA|nr:Acid sphingomyelinase-like phosphodiesterase 3b isoform 1 [Schistosoma japonicum]
MLRLIALAFSVVLLATSTRGNDTGYFWHLSDIHCDLRYVNKSCNLPFGNYSCDSPLELALNAINATRMLFTKQPDFVIWSGDNGPHDDSLTSDQLLDGIRLISKALKQAFPVDEIYILPVIGNHDVVPANNMEITPNSHTRTDLCHQLGNDVTLWGEWIDYRQQKKHSTSSFLSLPNPLDFPTANFSHACFFSHRLVHSTATYSNNNNSNDILRQPNLILISVNGLIWYQGNPLAGAVDPDPLGQLDWIQRTFQWARKRKDKVLLVSHFPPGASENAPQFYRFLRPEINDRFLNILIENADLLMAGLFAHEHVDSFRLLVSKSNIPVASLFLMPSISPLLLHGLGDFNPRIRLYRYKRSTMQLLGYSQYYFNLQNQLVNTEWQLEYDTMNTYHLPDLSSNSLNSLWNNFLQVDNGYWSVYWNYELGGRQHALKPNYLTENGLCPRAKSQCRCDHLCAMRFLILSDLDRCLQLCKEIKYTQSNDGSGTLQHPMFNTFNHGNMNNSSTYLNRSIIDQTSTANYNERSSLPYIVGVIVAFLVVLVGIVLIVNREVCNRHRGYHQRRSLLSSVINGVNGTGAGYGRGTSGNGLFLNTVNGALPISSFLHGTRLAAGANGTGTGGSCIELRTAFHPSYDDFDPEYFNKSVTSLNAITLSNGNIVQKHSNRMMRDNYVAPLAICDNATVLSPSCMISYYENPSDTSSSSYNSNNSNNNHRIKRNYIGKRYSVPDYANFKRYLSNYVNPTDRMAYVVNQLFDRCGHTSRLRHNHSITSNTATNDPQRVVNKISLTEEKSNTTSEQSSGCHHPQLQLDHKLKGDNCLPEDYYADDEAFGDEDCSEVYHNHRHHQLDKNDNVGDFNAGATDDVGSGQVERQLSQTGYHHLTVDKKSKLKRIIKKQSNPQHDQHNNNCDIVSKVPNHTTNCVEDEDDDSISDHVYHFDQKSQLLNTNNGDGKHSKDRKFAFYQSKHLKNSLSSPHKSSDAMSYNQSAFLNELGPNSVKGVSTCQNNKSNIKKHSLSNSLTSSLTCFPGESNIHSKSDYHGVMLAQQYPQHQHQSQSSYTSPSRRDSHSLSSTPSPAVDKLVNHRHYHLNPPPPYISNQQQLLPKLSSLNESELHCDVNSIKHLHDNPMHEYDSVRNNLISCHNSPPPPTVVNLSVLKVPGYDYVRMSN